MYDNSPRDSALVSGHSYIGEMANAAASYGNQFNFALGVTVGLNSNRNPVDWGHLEYLAKTIQSVTHGSEQVHVVCKGGQYHFGHFCKECPSRQDSQGGNFIVVFNTHETVYLTGTETDRRQWFGSILAPFAEVVVDGSIGFIDGIVVAKSYRETGITPEQIQIHGRCPLSTISAIHTILACGYETNCKNSYPPTDSIQNPSVSVGGVESHTRVTCSDRRNKMSTKRCLKKQMKGKCTKSKVSKKCDYTCGCTDGFTLPDLDTFSPSPP